MGQETNRKMEPTFYTKANTSDEDEYQAEKGGDIAETYYSPDKFIKTTKYKVQRPFHQNQKDLRRNHSSKTSINWRNYTPLKTSTKGGNPQKDGQTTQCKIWQSINHWVPKCPNKDVYEVINHWFPKCPNKNVYEVSYMSTNLHSTTAMKQHYKPFFRNFELRCLRLLRQQYICRSKWFTKYSKTLWDKKKSTISFNCATKHLNLGEVKILFHKIAIMPVIIGQHRASLRIYCRQSNIPLLLSKFSMKKGEIQLTLANNTIT